MASRGQQFPPQTQEKQPGKEHVMDPLPQYISPDYKPSNKLRVWSPHYRIYILFFFFSGFNLLFNICFNLQGKVALVTGGDSGIGRAVCYSFILEGATVAFTYVKSQEDKDAQDTLQILKKDKSADARDPMAIPADLGFDENCKKVVDEVVNAYGRIDILVNNAAEQHKSTSVEDIDEERLERVFRTNFFSYFFMTRYIL